MRKSCVRCEVYLLWHGRTARKKQSRKRTSGTLLAMPALRHRVADSHGSDSTPRREPKAEKCCCIEPKPKIEPGLRKRSPLIYWNCCCTAMEPAVRLGSAYFAAALIKLHR